MTNVIEIANKLSSIAVKYAQLFEGYSHYHDKSQIPVTIDAFTKECRFHIRPSTSGMGIHLTFPLSLLEEENIEEELVKLADIQKNKLAEERKRNTCSCCGHPKFVTGDFIW
jgi:hypothetical protein